MTKPKYDPQTIEKKWQKAWKETQAFKVDIDPSLPKYYILDMFPYPSGAGLHVGHVTGYTGTDIIARFMRQKGFNVLHPMGWDSFGLPAEQYAIRTGTHPAVTTQVNIDTYRRQLESLGFSYDWDREIATSDPGYYKWTQWIFTKLFEKGLAYEAEVSVNFCPALGTVLANEEVENGRSKEGGYPVERRPLKQWILKITAYADRLLADLDLLDWPDHLKKLQTNWIGRSVGALVDFPVEGGGAIQVYTTRPDTLFGVSYVVLAPEHPLISQITPASHRAAVEAYQRQAAAKSDLERSELTQEKTGVWTGAFASHPITGKQVPVWVADYVLGGYGTGAVMGVPGNDERDFGFAQRYRLPVIPVYDPHQADPETRAEVLAGKRPWTEDGLVVGSAHYDCTLNGLSMGEAIEKVTAWLEKQGKGKRAVQYKLRDWLFSRQRYWGEPIPILHFPDGSMRALELDELPLTPPHLDDFKPHASGQSPLAKVREWVEVVDPQTGKKAVRETNTMPQWAGSCWYYLRFCDPHNSQAAWSQEAERYWMPVDLYVGGVEHAVLHLLYARFWHKVLYDLKLVHTPEPFMRLRNQGLVTARSYKRPGGGYVAPDEVTEREGRAFSRAGEELIVQTEKMSKSKLNGVSPDEMIHEFGADALRLYEMFMGPFDREKVWSTDAVSGCRRFLSRFFEMATSEKLVHKDDPVALKLTHRLLEAVVRDTESFQFNTAIAHMMEYLNAFLPLPHYPVSCVRIAIQLLYPYAPHIAEEMWEKIGSPERLATAPLPPVNPAYLVDETATYIIQINGKLRGRFDLPKDQTESELLELVKNNPDVQKHLVGEVIKTVFVPNKLLNIVTQT
jgi:leucyl-tRNA synthetase